MADRSSFEIPGDRAAEIMTHDKLDPVKADAMRQPVIGSDPTVRAFLLDRGDRAITKVPVHERFDSRTCALRNMNQKMDHHENLFLDGR